VRKMQEKLKLIEERLKQANVQEHDVYLIQETLYENQYLKNKIQISRSATTTSYFLRVLEQKKDATGIGIVRTNAFSPSQIDAAINTAKKLARINKSPKYDLPDSNQSYSNVKVAETQVMDDPEQVLQDKSEELLNEISNQKAVVPTFGRLRLHHQKKYLINAKGLNLNLEKTFFYLELSLKSQSRGDIAEYWGKGYHKNTNDLNFSEIIPEWARFSQDSLKAKHPIPMKELIVVFPPRVLREALVPVIGFHASGRARHEHMSQFQENKKVGMEKITVSDDGLLENALQTSPWDGEGNPCGKTTIIENGVFKNYIYDQTYARLENAKSTGNGLRTSEGSIINAPSNFIISPGTVSDEEIIEEIKNGIYVMEFSWLNPSEVTGTFGAEIRLAYKIEDGRITKPIKGGNIGGNILEMIKNIKHVSKERKLVGNVLFPLMSFENLILST